MAEYIDREAVMDIFGDVPMCKDTMNLIRGRCIVH